MSNVRSQTLLASAARTANSESTGVDMFGGNYGTVQQHYAKRMAVYLVATAKTGTTPTLDVEVQDSADNVNWTRVGTFTQLNDAIGSERKQFEGPFRRYVRVKYTFGGSATPGYTFAVTAVFEE